MNRNDLRLGLPHTNLNGFSETALLKFAGHFQWNAIADGLGRPLSELRTREGHPIYATFFYVEEKFPESRPLSHFALDQDLTFFTTIRHFKGMAIDGQTVFDESRTFSKQVVATSDGMSFLGDDHPKLRMCNVFVAHGGQNEFLKMTTPERCSFDRIPVLPPEDYAYSITRAAANTLNLGLIPDGATPFDREAAFVVPYKIDPDRDTNGAGLVYFAQYIAFLEAAERRALIENSSEVFSLEAINRRSLLHRRIAYYANIDTENTVDTRVSLFRISTQKIAVRFAMHRRSDGKLIALSEACKII